MTEDYHSSRIPPISEYPDPMVWYSIDDEGATIETVNEPFQSIFGPAETGMLVENVLNISSPKDRKTLEIGGTLTIHSDRTTNPAKGVNEATNSDSQASSSASSKHYHGRVMPPDEEPGCIVFIECTHEIGVDRVASVISHDLRNPLDVAKAHLEAIDDSVTNEGSASSADLATHITHIENAHGRIERIIEDVLTLARGDDVITPDARVDLEAVATCAWQTVETADATAHFDDSLQTVTGDRDRLTRLFENLFRNSVEHGSTNSRPDDDSLEHGSRSNETQSTDTQEDGSQKDNTVTIRVGSLADGFFVEDDGPGIEPERREEIFKPGRTDTAHGTGLGLAIVDRIVTHHGWSVTATEGTTGGARIEIRGVDDA